MIKWRDGINILEELAKCGFTSYYLRKERIWGEATIQKFREGGLPTWKELDFICSTLNCNVGDYIEFIRDK